MMTSSFIKTFLRVNSLSVDSPESDIRAAMTNARWNENEVIEALALIGRGKEGVVTPKTESGSTALGDRIVLPSIGGAVSGLASQLGVSMVADFRARDKERKEEVEREMRRALVVRFIFSTVLAICITIVAGLAIAYLENLGPFFKLSPEAQIWPADAVSAP